MFQGKHTPRMSESPEHTPRKVALITGVTGQDGSYLAEFLLGKGYEVHGIIRRSSSFNTGRIEHLYKVYCCHKKQSSDNEIWHSWKE